MAKHGHRKPLGNLELGAVMELLDQALDDGHGESHDVSIRPLDPVDETRGDSLNAVGTGLVHRLPCRHVGADLAVVKIHECDPGCRDCRPSIATTDDGNTGQDFVSTPGQLPKHRDRLGCVTRFTQDLAIDNNDRVGTQHESAVFGPVRHRGGLGYRHPNNEGVRRFVNQALLVHTRRHDVEGVSRSGQ